MTEPASLRIDGVEIDVLELTGHEGMSQLFRYRVLGRVPAERVAAHEWPGTSAHLTLNDGHGAQRVVSAVVASVATQVHDDGSAAIELDLASRAHVATLGRDCRYFLDRDVRAIVDEVLVDVPHRWALTRSHPRWPYTVQYRESDWNFALRLLEREGISFWFDHSAGSTLVLTDDTTLAPDILGGGTMAYRPDTGMEADRPVIIALGSRGRQRPTAFVRRSFSPERPRLEVGGSSGAGALEHYDAPAGGTSDPAEAQRQADFAAAAAAAASVGLTGIAGSVNLVPGRAVTVQDHPGTLNGRHLITGLSLRIEQRRRDDDSDHVTLVTRFDAIPSVTPHISESRALAAQQAGVQSGTVMGPPGEEIHPDGAGRVRVRMHWARTGGDGWWLRVAQRGTHDSLQVPRVGWNVLSFNDEGAVDAPSVLARILDAEHPPPYPLPANKTRMVFRTHTSPSDGSHNELYFEDTDGAQQMYLHASRDMDLMVEADRSDTVDRDSLRNVGRDRRLTVHTTRREEVEGDQADRVGALDRLEVGASNAEEVMQDLDVTIGGDRRIKVSDAHDIAVAGHRSLVVSSMLSDTSLGDLQADAPVFSKLVGAAEMNLSAGTQTQEAGALLLSMVGGLRIRVTGAEHTVSADLHTVEAVGGLLMQKTASNFSDLAETSSSFISGLGFDLKGKTITVKAEDIIQIVCGESSVTLLPEEIVIGGKKLDISKAPDLVVETKKVKHN